MAVNTGSAIVSAGGPKALPKHAMVLSRLAFGCGSPNESTEGALKPLDHRDGTSYVVIPDGPDHEVASEALWDAPENDTLDQWECRHPECIDSYAETGPRPDPTTGATESES
jgi:hypothetical protein